MITKEEVIEKLKNVYDPEIPVNVVDLGLIYKVDVDDKNNITIDMTLTAPGCPLAGMIAKYVEEELKKMEEVGEITVNLVWEPQWTPDMMSEEAKQKLGWS